MYVCMSLSWIFLALKEKELVSILQKFYLQQKNIAMIKYNYAAQ